MNDIFISYRRDDSAGHAGRLFDGLRARFGAGHVFMDVTDLRPGQDFAVELERAVGRADCVLAVIGPRWLQAVDAAGRRRIDDPDDFVRREIALGLAHGATVIPVLVHGAALPRAAELPEPLQPLARRQAVELSDPRWDSDLRELIASLAEGTEREVAAHATGAAPHTPSPAGRGLGGAALAALVLLAGGLWFALRAPSDPIAAPAPGAVTDRSRPQPQTQPQAQPQPQTKPHPPRYAIALPPLTEVRFRTNRAQVVFSILAIRQEPRDSSTQVLSFRVRMLNLGPADEAFGSDQFRLVAGERSIEPSDSLIGSTEGLDAKETTLRFITPAGLADVALEVRVYAENTRMPIPLSARTIIPDDVTLDDFGLRKAMRVVDAVRQFPVRIAVDRDVEVGKAAYRISTALVERETAEKASLAVTVRCAPARGSGGASFGSSSVRLWIDGVPRAPVNNVNMAVDTGDSKEAVFVFDLLALPSTLEVGVRHGAEVARIPLPVSALVPR